MSNKRKPVNQSSKSEEKEPLPPVVVHLAQLNGVDPQQIAAWKTYKCGKVSLVTTHGEKFIAERIGLDFLSETDEVGHDPQP